MECEAERRSNGPVSTELFFEGKTPKQIERMIMLNPLKRLVEPEDIAHVVSFVLSPQGGWINARLIRANGGAV